MLMDVDSTVQEVHGLLVDYGSIVPEEANDVSECFSPPRVVPLAWKRGLTGGWSLDIKAQDAKGQVWDLRDPKVVKRAKQLIRKTKPKVLIGSPHALGGRPS